MMLHITCQVRLKSSIFCIEELGSFTQCNEQIQWDSCAEKDKILFDFIFIMIPKLYDPVLDVHHTQHTQLKGETNRESRYRRNMKGWNKLDDKSLILTDWVQGAPMVI